MSICTTPSARILPLNTCLKISHVISSRNISPRYYGGLQLLGIEPDSNSTLLRKGLEPAWFKTKPKRSMVLRRRWWQLASQRLSSRILSFAIQSQHRCLLWTNNQPDKHDGGGITSLKEAIDVLEKCSRVDSDERYAHLLRQCSNLKALTEGKRVHAHIVRGGFAGQRFLGNLLVQMYGNCGSLDEACAAFRSIGQKNVFSWNIMLGAYAQNGHLEGARRTFEEMPEKTVVSWNSMIQAYANHGHVEEARCIFDRMAHPNVVSHTVMIAAYAQKGYVEDARDMFEKMPQPDTVAWNAMIQAYAHNGRIEEARNLFDRLSQKNVVSWTTMIQAYAQNGYLEDARSMFDRMRRPDSVAWNVMIQAYAQNRQLDDARYLFDRMPEPDVVTWTAMLAAYAQSGHVEDAKNLFDRMSHRDVVSWNSMVTAYARSGHLEQAKSLFDKMPTQACSWNGMLAAYAQNGHMVDARSTFDTMPVRSEVSWNTIVSGYAQNGLLEDAKSICERMPEQTTVAWNAMIAAYAQAGHVEAARRMFDRMSERNAVSWTAMVGAYAKEGDGKEALNLFKLMDLEGVKPVEVTYTSVLDACSSFSGLADGKLIHATIVDTGLDSCLVVGNALVNMYGKCGSLEDARIAFDKLPERSAVSWNTMLAAYAQNGRARDVLELFKAMNLEGARPDRITLISVLSACSHAGLLRDGLVFLASIREDFGVELHLDHYKCGIDLLGRSGQLEAAEKLIHTMPFPADDGVWMALLSACKSLGNVERGARAAENALKLNPDDPSPYLLLSNIHAAAGNLDELSPES